MGPATPAEKCATRMTARFLRPALALVKKIEQSLDLQDQGAQLALEDVHERSYEGSAGHVPALVAKIEQSLDLQDQCAQLEDAHEGSHEGSAGNETPLLCAQLKAGSDDERTASESAISTAAAESILLTFREALPFFKEFLLHREEQEALVKSIDAEEAEVCHSDSLLADKSTETKEAESEVQRLDRAIKEYSKIWDKLLEAKGKELQKAKHQLASLQAKLKTTREQNEATLFESEEVEEAMQSLSEQVAAGERLLIKCMEETAELEKAVAGKHGFPTSFAIVKIFEAAEQEVKDKRRTMNQEDETAAREVISLSFALLRAKTIESFPHVSASPSSLSNFSAASVLGGDAQTDKDMQNAHPASPPALVPEGMVCGCVRSMRQKSGYWDTANTPQRITDTHRDLLDMTAGESRRTTLQRVLRSRKRLLNSTSGQLLPACHDWSEETTHKRALPAPVLGKRNGPTPAGHMCVPGQESAGTSDLKGQSEQFQLLLRSLLEQAVLEERYEDAARLRDMIKDQGVAPPKDVEAIPTPRLLQEVECEPMQRARERLLLSRAGLNNWVEDANVSAAAVTDMWCGREQKPASIALEKGKMPALVRQSLKSTPPTIEKCKEAKCTEATSPSAAAVLRDTWMKAMSRTLGVDVGDEIRTILEPFDPAWKGRPVEWRLYDINMKRGRGIRRVTST